MQPEYAQLSGASRTPSGCPPYQTEFMKSVVDMGARAYCGAASSRFSAAKVMRTSPTWLAASITVMTDW